LAHTRMACTIETGARHLLDPLHKHEPTLVSPDPSARKRRIDFLLAAVDLAAELGTTLGAASGVKSNAPCLSLSYAPRAPRHHCHGCAPPLAHTLRPPRHLGRPRARCPRPRRAVGRGCGLFDHPAAPGRRASPHLPTRSCARSAVPCLCWAQRPGHPRCPGTRAQPVQPVLSPPLGSFDTGYHAISSCRDQALSGMITDRHNKVARQIARAVRAGTLGGYHLLSEAGRGGDQDDAAPTATVPAWLLPGVSQRSDIMLIQGLDDAPNAPASRRRHRGGASSAPAAVRRAGPPPDVHPCAEYTLIPAEVTVGGDSDVLAAVARKQQKYCELISNLRARGWTVLGSTPTGPSPPPAPT
jgi:hypothetical protein